jgi:polysaccharide export outer membrane protein
MFKQGDYQVFEMTNKMIDEYVINPDDELIIEVFSRDGFKLVDVLSESGLRSGNVNSGTNTSTGNGVNTSTNTYHYKYRVNRDGFATLPILGDYYVKGYTERELKKVLEQEYARIFQDPFVITRVVNRRVFVFKGDYGAVVSLNEEPTSLIEILARTNGMNRDLKAYNIKIIRGNPKSPTIYKVDLSSIEGMRKAELTLQSNDIIYVEPRRRPISDTLREAATILSLLTSITSAVLLIRTLGGK